MNIFPIKNDSDYQAALAEIDKLMDAEINTPEGDALDGPLRRMGHLRRGPRACRAL